MPLPVVGSVRSGRSGRLLARWVPAGWRGARLDPGRPGMLVVAVVAGLAAVLAAAGVWRDRPVVESAPALPLVAESPVSAGAPAPGGPVVISVVGKVPRPGLVRLTDGARVADAIAAAGGPLPKADLSTVNLARRVVDGEQIAVGVPRPPKPAAGPVPEAGAGPRPGGSAGGAGVGGIGGVGGKVDLNRATLEQLDSLPGVGPVTARKILDWRARNGRFSSVDQLREVDGIGERRFSTLREQVTV